MSAPARVPHQQLELGDEQLVIWNGRPFTGIAVQADLEVPYVAGLIEGVSVLHEDGRLAETVTYWQGVRHGPTTEFDRAGQHSVDEVYEYGILAARRVWSNEGRVSSEWAIGPGDDLYRILHLSRRRFDSIAPPVEGFAYPPGT